MTNISPANRAHTEALTALTANDEAIRTLRAQREKLLNDEAKARAALGRGESSPTILDAITDNLAKAAALLPAIESLEAARPSLIRAVERATGEQWAEQVRALAPEGTYAAMQGIRDELAETIREAVETARAKAEAISAEAGRLIDQAQQLERHHALPRGARYSTASGLTLDGISFIDSPVDNFAEKVGKALDQDYRSKVHAAAMVRYALDHQAQDAAVQAELEGARAAMFTAPAGGVR